MWSNGMDLRVKNLVKDMKGVLKVKKKGEELSGGVHTDPGTVYFGTARHGHTANLAKPDSVKRSQPADPG